MSQTGMRQALCGSRTIPASPLVSHLHKAPASSSVAHRPISAPLVVTRAAYLPVMRACAACQHGSSTPQHSDFRVEPCNVSGIEVQAAHHFACIHSQPLCSLSRTASLHLVLVHALLMVMAVPCT